MDKNYKHVMSGRDETVTSYLRGKPTRQYTALSFQRVERNRIRIQEKFQYIWDYNYMSFKNTSHENRYFYCFIDTIRYINEEVCEIEYTLDVMTTFLGQYRLLDCFVVREHTASDELFEHLTPEGLETGDYISNREQETEFSHDLSYIVQYVEENSSGSIRGGLPTPVTTKTGNARSASTLDEINSLLWALLNDPLQRANVIGVGTMPTTFCVNSETPITTTIPLQFNEDSIDGYKPKNRKLYSFPYNFITIYTPFESKIFKWENFISIGEPTAQFNFTATVQLNSSVICTLQNYRFTGPAINETMTLGPFPQLAYATDSFAQWIAQNAAQEVISTSIGVAGAAVAMAASPVAGAIGLASVIGGELSQITDAALQQPKYMAGSSVSPLVANRTFEYVLCTTTIRGEQAQIIDNYFTAYGYKCGKIKTPDIESRPSFNYVQTQGCKITGNIPNEYKRIIESVFDAGVTFWHDPNNIGDYSVDNTATGGYSLHTAPNSAKQNEPEILATVNV